MHKNTLHYCAQKKQELEVQGTKNKADKHEIPSPVMLSGTKVLTG